MDDKEAVVVELHDGWAELILNRPERKNAIVGPLGEALTQQLEGLCRNDDVRVIMLRGAGGAFCSGLDLKAFNASPEPAWLGDFQRIWRGAHSALYNANKPIVGVLQRYAINGGAALALACDLLMVGRGAYLQVGEVQIGMSAPYNLAWLSLRHSESVLARLALLGDRVSGEELVQLGVAQFCEDDDQLLASGHALLEKMAAFEGQGLARIKSGVRARQQFPADDWFDRFTALARQADAAGGSAGPKAMRP